MRFEYRVSKQTTKIQDGGRSESRESFVSFVIRFFGRYIHHESARIELKFCHEENRCFCIQYHRQNSLDNVVCPRTEESVTNAKFGTASNDGLSNYFLSFFGKTPQNW